MKKKKKTLGEIKTLPMTLVYRSSRRRLVDRVKRLCSTQLQQIPTGKQQDLLSL